MGRTRADARPKRKYRNPPAALPQGDCSMCRMWGKASRPSRGPKLCPCRGGVFCAPLYAAAMRPVLTPVCALRQAHFKAQLAQHAGSHILFAAAAYFGKAVLSIKCKGRGIVFHNKKAQILRALP